MSLRGTLNEFTLPDVLGILATTAKAGCLEIHGDRGNGSAWVADGVLLAVQLERSADTPLEEALFELLRFEHGTFMFTPDERLDANDPRGQDIHQTLGHAIELLAEWRELQNVVPSMDHVVSLAPELPHPQVTIDAEAWTALVAVAQARPVGEVAHAFGLGELAVCRLLQDLIQLGVAVVTAPTGAPAHTIAC